MAKFGQTMPDGKGPFADAIVRFRNRDLHAYFGLGMQFRMQLIRFGEFRQESGWSDAINVFALEHLARMDDYRRRIARNPGNADLKSLRDSIKTLGIQIPGNPNATHPDVNQADSNASRPAVATSVTSDDVARPNAPEMDLNFRLDGSDPNIPLIAPVEEAVANQIEIHNAHARILLLGFDLHLTNVTRLDDRDASHRTTAHAALMLYEDLAELVDVVANYGGDQARMAVPHGVRASEEPRGPQAATNQEPSGNQV